MVAHGYVVVAHDTLSLDLYCAVFARALPELFALPLDVKRRTVSSKGEFEGYLGLRPDMAWESLGIREPTNASSVCEFAGLLWAECGNPEFCEMIVSFAKNMMKLEQTVETLLLEGLGVRGEKIVGATLLLEGLGVLGIRFSHYGTPLDRETSMSMQVHYDDSMVTAVVQHEVEGLELHVGDGRWVAVPAEPGTITFLAGEHLRMSASEMIVSFAKNMMKLEQTVETLLLEGLGVRGEKIVGATLLLEGLGVLGIRFSHYGTPLDRETSVSMQVHYDDSMVTAVVQHEVEGLELHAGDGRWVAVPAEPGTITFLAGEHLRVGTNGRVPAGLHRVRTPSHRERFAVLFGRRQKAGVEVHAIGDLVDEEHPLQFNPLRHEEYSKWRYTEEGLKFKDRLKAYCGVDKDGAVV